MEEEEFKNMTAEELARHVKQEKERTNKFGIIMFGIIFVGTIFLSIFNKALPIPIIDEIPHFEQIIMILNANFSILYYLTVIPGFHYIIAGFMKVLQIGTLTTTRTLVFILNAVLFFPLVYNLSKDNKIKRMINFAFFPIFFTYYFLIYTDIFSMIFVLMTYYFLIYRRYKTAGLTCIISILIRQNNFIWMGLWGLCILADSLRDTPTTYKYKKVIKTIITNIIKKGWVFALGILGFIGFVIWNGGLVIGDRIHHQPSIYPQGIWFFFATITMFFWPIILNNLKKIKINKSRIVLYIGLFLVYLGTWSNFHLYNTFDAMLRNKIILWTLLSPINVIILFIPVLLGIIYVVDILEFKNKWLFMFFSLILVGFSHLIEYRYYFLPIAFILLYRKIEDKFIENFTLFYWISLAIIMFFSIQSWKIFW